MDAEQFDALLRSLTSGASRRRVLASLMPGLLAALTSRHGEVADARKKRKGKKKRRCTPRCNGKTCGSNGCRGSCGRCDGGTCVAGVCQCSSELVFCRGACIPGCIGEAIISPLTCACCQTGPDCVSDIDCCSGICQPNTGGGADFCVARTLGASCDFDAQCQSTVCPPAQCPLHLRPICRDEQCGCPDDTEECQGECVPPCAGGNVHIPGACACCRRNAQTCGGVTPCCSEVCDTSQVPSRCAGLLPNDPCDFDEQCTSGSCTLGFCEG